MVTRLETRSRRGKISTSSPSKRSNSVLDLLNVFKLTVRKDLSELSEASMEGSIRNIFTRSRAALTGKPPEKPIRSGKFSPYFNS